MQSRDRSRRFLGIRNWRRFGGLMLLMLAAAAVAESASAMGPKESRRRGADVDKPRVKREAGASPRCEAVFSPGGGCESRIVSELEAAERAIRVQMYMFTSKRIAGALSAAAKRGVGVEVILDKSQEKMTYAPWRNLRKSGVKVFFDAAHDTANNKVVLIDDAMLITGSYNFTKAAEEKNAENILIVRDDADLLAAYRANFDAHLNHARPAP